MGKKNKLKKAQEYLQGRINEYEKSKAANQTDSAKGFNKPGSMKIRPN